MNIDIKDYFMSGIQSDLVGFCGEHVLGNRKTAFKEALKFLLESQFVQISDEDLDAYMVIVGSGMGVECSGDASDIAFYELAEKPFVLRQDIRRQYHIELYARFRDNIIVIIGGDSRTALNLVTSLRVIPGTSY